MNIFIGSNICGFFQTKYIRTFIRDFFSPHEYIRTFIRNVRFQQIHCFEAAQQSKICYSKKHRQNNISAINVLKKSPVLISYLIFTIRFAKIFGQYFSFGYIHTFICEYTTWTNIFGHSFVKM